MTPMPEPPLTMFTAEEAAYLDEIAETLREWASHARERGVAAIFEAAQLNGMGDRVLSWEGGERLMTDLAHMTQLLQEAAHREHFTLPALRDWLRAHYDGGSLLAAASDGVSVLARAGLLAGRTVSGPDLGRHPGLQAQAASWVPSASPSSSVSASIE